MYGGWIGPLRSRDAIMVGRNGSRFLLFLYIAMLLSICFLYYYGLDGCIFVFLLLYLSVYASICGSDTPWCGGNYLSYLLVLCLPWFLLRIPVRDCILSCARLCSLQRETWWFITWHFAIICVLPGTSSQKPWHQCCVFWLLDQAFLCAKGRSSCGYLHFLTRNCRLGFSHAENSGYLHFFLENAFWWFEYPLWLLDFPCFKKSEILYSVVIFGFCFLFECVSLEVAFGDSLSCVNLSLMHFFCRFM